MDNENTEADSLPKIWVVSWAYSDKSGSGIIRAFESEETAKDLLGLLNAYGGQRGYYLEAVEICKEYD